MGLVTIPNQAGLLQHRMSFTGSLQYLWFQIQILDRLTNVSDYNTIDKRYQHCANAASERMKLVRMLREDMCIFLIGRMKNPLTEMSGCDCFLF